MFFKDGQFWQWEAGSVALVGGDFSPQSGWPDTFVFRFLEIFYVLLVSGMDILIFLIRLTLE